MQLAPTTCLVTGGAGAIGSNLAAALVAEGHEVIVVDDLSSGHRHHVPAQARMIVGSIEEPRVLADAFAARPTHVFHLAALFANQNSVDHPDRDLAVNGQGLLNVLEHAARCGARKLLYTSSSCVYGNKTVMREDETDLVPDTPYGITKLMGEHYCRFWSDQRGLDTVVVRLFNTYGPHEYPGRYRNVIPNFIALALRGEPLPVTGTGEETRDFNYVDDTVAGIRRAMAAPTRPAEVYNLASGLDTRIIDMARLVNDITGSKAGLDFRPRRGWDHVLIRRGDPAKAAAAFGHGTLVTLEEGIRRTCAWIRQATR